MAASIRKGLRLFPLLLAYCATCVVYTPCGVSASIGALIALYLLYPRSVSSPPASFGSPRRTLAVLIGLLVLPLAIVAAAPYLPLFLVTITQIDTSSGSYPILPNITYLILYLAPLALLWKVRARREEAAAPNASPWTRARLPLLCLLIILPACIARTLLASQYAVSCAFMTSDECLYLALKSFWYNGLWEELFYRGALITVLLCSVRPSIAIAIAATVFSLHHVDLFRGLLTGSNPRVLYDYLGVFVLGITCGIIYVRSRSLLPCILYHGVLSGYGYFLAFLEKSGTG